VLKLNKKERRRLGGSAYGQLCPSSEELEIIEGFRSVL
jgi:hypothetical protein